MASIEFGPPPPPRGKTPHWWENRKTPQARG